MGTETGSTAVLGDAGDPTTIQNEVPAAATLVPDFELARVLNQDQSARRLSLLGRIRGEPALLVVERAALPSKTDQIKALHALFTRINTLGANDVYHWYMASLGKPASSPSSPALIPDLKLNLIYPCTEAHVRKYEPQALRMVVETPEIYDRHVKGWMQKKRGQGRLNWVYNILEGRQEQEQVIYRSFEAESTSETGEGFLLLPDMNWDRTTMKSLRILGLVERRDLMSLRDLRKADIPWLQRVHDDLLAAVEDVYGAQGVERDMLKVYVHYQPTYYHFHLHVVSVEMEPNATQAVGKAFSLPNLLGQLRTMAGGPDSGMKDVDLAYSIGEKHDLWTEVFGPLKASKAKENRSENE